MNGGGAHLAVRGGLFHSPGAAVAKARSPFCLGRDRGTASSIGSEDLRDLEVEWGERRSEI